MLRSGNIPVQDVFFFYLKQAAVRYILSSKIKAMGKGLEIIHPHAAGIDIGSRSFYVWAEEDEIKVFPTYTEGCHMLRDYLKEKNVTTVAMESTGVYWVILHGILEEAGIGVYLVNGRDVKNVPGRKSDAKDCQ